MTIEKLYEMFVIPQLFLHCKSNKKQEASVALVQLLLLLLVFLAQP